jgi:MOSC domain-containing protein YiiM
MTASPMDLRGTLEAIYIASTAGAPMHAIESARVEIARGIEGDRYFTASGSFSRWPGEVRPISLIEAETLDAIRAEFSIDLAQGQSRRNLVTRNVRLPSLINRTFRIGPIAIFRGTRECAPCRYLARLLNQPALFDALRKRGGIRADVLVPGTIMPGDSIEFVTLSPPTAPRRQSR